MTVRSTSISRCRRATLLGLLLCMALGAAPGLASANGPSRFVVELCDPAIPGGNAPGAVFNGDERYVTPYNLCAYPSGSLAGSLGIYGAREFGKDNSQNSLTLPVSAPPGGGIEALAVSASSCGTSQWSEYYVLEPGWPPNCIGESRATVKFNPALPSAAVPIVMNCSGSCPAGGSVYARYISVKEVDPVAPQVVAVGGSLLSGEVARGHQSLSAEATDQGGGRQLPAALPSRASEQCRHLWDGRRLPHAVPEDSEGELDRGHRVSSVPAGCKLGSGLCQRLLLEQHRQ